MLAAPAAASERPVSRSTDHEKRFNEGSNEVLVDRDRVHRDYRDSDPAPCRGYKGASARRAAAQGRAGPRASHAAATPMALRRIRGPRLFAEFQFSREPSVPQSEHDTPRE